MRFLLDTNACIALLNDSSRPLVERIREQPPKDVGLPTVVLYELFYGAYKSQRLERNVAVLDRMLFEAVPFDPEDAREAGAIRAELERTGRPIGPYDVMIAGQARSRDVAIVTANGREFGRVAGLRWEDWSGTA